MIPQKGLFIVFEGIDGSGKTIQIAHLLHYIRTTGNKYQKIYSTREPTHFAQEVIVALQSEQDAYASKDLMLQGYVQDRIQHSELEITPLLQRGAVVLCDRYRMSTDAFQTAQGLDKQQVIEAQEHPSILVPHITFLLDIPPHVGIQRMQHRGGIQDKFDDAGVEFHTKVREQYLSLAREKQASSRYGTIYIIDGNRDPVHIAQDISALFFKEYKRWLEQEK
ncbi:MAG: dTMP kinase [Candidatus Woesearchaeota archaeon]